MRGGFADIFEVKPGRIGTRANHHGMVGLAARLRTIYRNSDFSRAVMIRVRSSAKALYANGRPFDFRLRLSHSCTLPVSAVCGGFGASHS